MSDVVNGEGLSAVERVVDVFVAPSKTFRDILQNTSWWLPFVLLVIVTTGVTATIDKQVGYGRAAENQVKLSPKQEETMNQLPPEQREARMKTTATITRYASYGSPIFILIFSALGALVMWGSFNFGLGASTTYGQMFAVWIYASMPRLLSGLLTIVTLVFGGNAENFNMKDPVGTNGVLSAGRGAVAEGGAGFCDVIGLWNVALLVIGTAIVAKVKMGSAAAVVVGWWVVALVLSVGAATAFS